MRNSYVQAIQIFIALIICGCSGCSREGNDATPLHAALEERIATIPSLRRLSGNRARKAVTEICSTISTLTNKPDRIKLLKKLSEGVSRVSVSDFSDEEKVSAEHSFWAPTECVAYHMMESGFSEAEVGEFVLKGMRDYREICFSIGDLPPPSTEDSVETRERRLLSRGLRAAWTNDMGFFERNSIGTIFYSASPEARARFLQRWHDEFGCFDSCHKGK